MRLHYVSVSWLKGRSFFLPETAELFPVSELAIGAGGRVLFGGGGWVPAGLKEENLSPPQPRKDRHCLLSVTQKLSLTTEVIAAIPQIWAPAT